LSLLDEIDRDGARQMLAPPPLAQVAAYQEVTLEPRDTPINRS
jgi:hypothetical protein